MKKNIVILGHGVGVKFSIESLRRKPEIGFHIVAVITHPLSDHGSDLELIKKRQECYGDYAYNVFDLKIDYGIPVHEASDVNDEQVIQLIKSYEPEYLISISCRNILKDYFLNSFKGKVLNIHTTPLPAYRGAANDTWMILNGLWGTEQYGCVHFIDKGIDTGDIIAKVKYSIPEKSYPIDVYKARIDTFTELLPLALKNLNRADFLSEKQIIDESSCFPRLNTTLDAVINWNNWDGLEIEKFIYAFSYPFAGAHCFLEEVKVHILEAEFIKGLRFHPFATGIIFGRNECGQYKVALRSGYLLIKKIEVGGFEITQSKFFRLGKKLT
jgi:methionyl-tRNA formyltransferase